MLIKLYLITLSIILILDYLWLGIIAKSFYKQQLDFLLRDNINWIPAILFYLLFATALIYFIYLPFSTRSYVTLIASAFFFGIMVYATYDLTNMATIKNWPLIVTIIDIFWGGVLATLTIVITKFIFEKFA